MKKLIIVLLFVGLLIPAVSAEILYDEYISDYSFTGASYEVVGGISYQGGNIMNGLEFPDITKCNDISYIVVEGKYGSYLDEGQHLVEYWFTDDTENRKTAKIYIDHIRNILGSITSTKATIFLYDWEIGDRVGRNEIEFSELILSGNRYYAPSRPSGMPVYVKSTDNKFPNHKVTISCGQYTQNHITIESTDYDYIIELRRVISGKAYRTNLVAYKDSEEVYFDGSNSDKTCYFLHNQIDEIKLITLSETHSYPLSTSTSPTEDPTVTVYIKNSQTGALIADANVVIDALVNGEYHPVVNRTEPSGIFSINLQPTGGGKPNPDGYRLIVTADGYNNPMPEINFTVDDYKNYIYCLLDPIAGGPVNENKTFIDFFVRDMFSNPISGATVKFGKYTLITNSAGYTVFEVDKNNNYSWTISKSGYGPLTGNAVIGNAPRHTINTVLAPIVTPTTPTSIQTSPSIAPTSTMTAPTGEPVSNWLEWFAAHFG
ncbi:MAG: carboxypeptidase-like regulatory domain-containing protein, partial [Bacilli bacterium]|nr:carboxypeptidase-like regulatory domain-containing protein [Bacilli bacterium]